MPRKSLYRSQTLPYHVTARSNNRERFHLELGMLWKLMGTESLSTCMKFGAEFHSLVLMPNHFHILMTAPNYDLGIIMRDFISGVTRESNRLTGRTGHMFGGPYHWSLVSSSRYFGHAYKYVYRNPVKARLSESVETYPFSTLNGLLGANPLMFPISHARPELTFSLPGTEPADLLTWLNRPFPKEAEKLIKIGLQRKIFDKIICRKTREEYPELKDLI